MKKLADSGIADMHQTVQNAERKNEVLLSISVRFSCGKLNWGMSRLKEHCIDLH